MPQKRMSLSDRHFLCVRERSYGRRPKISCAQVLSIGQTQQAPCQLFLHLLRDALWVRAPELCVLLQGSAERQQFRDRLGMAVSRYLCESIPPSCVLVHRIG
jgi:hypothetical protein